MKKLMRVTCVILLMSSSFIVTAEDLTPYKEVMNAQMMDACDETKFLGCIGKSKQDCVSTMKKSIASCDHLFPKDRSGGKAAFDTAMTAYGDCLQKNILKNYGISEAKVKACDTPGDAPPVAPQ